MVKNNSSNLHCDKGWEDAWTDFNSLRPNAVVILLCIVGCVTNIFNLIVFTRKCMKSPTITILTMLAISDFLCVFQRILYEILVWQFTGKPRTISTQTTIIIFRFFASVFHFWSVFLTVGVAVWRFIMTRFPLRSRSWCTEQNAGWVILISFISSGLCAYLSRVLGEDVTKTRNTREYYGSLVHFWINSLVEKLFPCFILVFVSLRLRQSLMNAKRKRINMIVQTVEKAQVEKENFNRTTRMLLFAVLLFIVTELPSGILSFVTAIYFSTSHPPISFYQECFKPIRHLMGMLEYTSSIANFFIYYCTGANFKQTFHKTFALFFSTVMKMKSRVGGSFRFASVHSREQSTTGTLAMNQSGSEILPSLSKKDSIVSMETQSQSKPKSNENPGGDCFNISV